MRLIHKRLKFGPERAGYGTKSIAERVVLCKTCADGRGIADLPLIDGVEVGTLVDLAQWTLAADKVLTF